MAGTDRSEEQVAAELRCTQLLHEVATRLVSEENVHVIYGELMAAAIKLIAASCAASVAFDHEMPGPIVREQFV